ncbi:hypothetical protein MCETRE41_01160 [Candidatus Methylopumilus universalis]
MLKIKRSTLFLSKKELNSLFFIQLLISPILANYFFCLNLPLNIGDFLIILLTIFFFLPRLTDDNLKLKKLITFISALFFLVAFTNTIDLSHLKFFFYSTVLLILINLKKDDDLSIQFFSLYSKFGLFLSFFLFFQYANNFLFDHRLILNLPFPRAEQDSLIYLQDQFRPGSLFREPSYFVLFVTPLLFFYAMTKQHFLYLITLFAAIISTSSLIFPIILFERLFNYTNLDPKSASIKYFIYFFILATFFYLFRNSLVVNKAISAFDQLGAFNSRFLPGIKLVMSNLNFFSGSALEIPSPFESQWINSLALSIIYFGVFFLIIITVALFNFNFFIACLLIFFLSCTSYFNTPFATLIFFAFSQFSCLKKRFFNSSFFHN